MNALTSLVLGSVLLATTPAFAWRPHFGHETDRHRHASPPCDYYFSRCSAKFPASVKACQTLFDAAKASGGYWGQPDASKAAHPFWFEADRHVKVHERLCVP